MKKNICIRNIQKRLPNNVLLYDETDFEFSEDEYISILSWIKYFNKHYSKFHLTKLPEIIFPIISKRLRLDFGLYCTADMDGKYKIYLSENGKLLNGEVKKNIPIKTLVETWQL